MIASASVALSHWWRLKYWLRRWIGRGLSRMPRPNWREFYCVEGNVHIVIGNENYYLSADGLLMPAKKDQSPPDLRYFKRSSK